MNVAEIIAKLEATYANCASYVDAGCVINKHLTSDGQFLFDDKRPFKTAFVRPDRFRFEFSNTFPERTKVYRYIICANESGVQTFWDVKPGISEEKTLSMAIAGATGVSGGSAFTIPTLLMPEASSDQCKQLRFDFARLDDLELDGSVCFRIEKRRRLDPVEKEGLQQPATQVYWIDQSSFLIRRTEIRMRLPNSSCESITTYDPTMDQPVPAELLRFDPPDNQG